MNRKTKSLNGSQSQGKYIVFFVGSGVGMEENQKKW